MYSHASLHLLSYDSEGEGQISAFEYGHAIRATGMCPSNADVDTALAAMPQDGTNMVEFPDFVKSYVMMVGTDAAGGRAAVVSAMRIFDTLSPASGRAAVVPTTSREAASSGSMTLADLEDAMLKYGECLNDTEMAHLRKIMSVPGGGFGVQGGGGGGGGGGGVGMVDYETLIKTLCNTKVRP